MAALLGCTLIACFALTGCVKLTDTVTINADKSMDFAMDYGLSKEAYEQLKDLETSDDSSLSTLDSDDASTPEGWSVEHYENDDYIGAKATRHFSNIDDISVTEGTLEEWYGLDFAKVCGSNDSDGTSSLDELSNSKYFYYDSANKVYHFKVDVSSITQVDISNEQEALNEWGMGIVYDELSVTLALPTTAIDSNATSVSSDGKTLTWTYDAENAGFGGPSALEASFSMEGVSPISTPVIIAIVAFVVILIALIIVIVMMKKRRKKNAAPITSNAAPAASAAYEVQQPARPTDAGQVLNADARDNLQAALSRELTGLWQLKEQGILTQQEYDKKHSQLMQAYESALSQQ